MEAALIVAGIGLLYLGGEALVRGATALGRAWGLSPMVVGLTVVSMGTSSPELAASVTGVLAGAPAVAFGNIVGSNIANLGLVLGLTALLWPLRVASRFVRREVPSMLAASALVIPLVWNGRVDRFEALLLLAALAVYLHFLFRAEADSPAVEAEFASEFGRPRWSAGRSLLAVAAGVGLLALGAHLLIAGAVGVARTLGVSERVIGLTMVALGTSLPELASSLVAAYRREGDIVLGNLIGSNLFNVLFILGTTAAVRPLAVDVAASWLDLGVMMGLSLLVWRFLATGARLSRGEGAVLIAAYLAYAVYLYAY